MNLKLGKIVFLLLATFFSKNLFATFMPPNNLHLQDRIDMDSNIDEKKFNEIIDNIMQVYVPIAKGMKANLSVNKLWTNATVNASANQSGSSWVINMYGGLARRPEVTPDGFALVVCHELGHHFGGYAFYAGATAWAASEGQADYYATQVCGREIWKADVETNAGFRNSVDAGAKAKCDANWKDAKDQDLCYRISMGGKSLADLLGALGGSGKTNFTTPDPSQVATTNTAHPRAQCRLDTYFNGALCTKNADLNFIPGKGHASGQGSAAAEQEANKYSCATVDQFADGVRPRCWFKPLL